MRQYILMYFFAFCFLIHPGFRQGFSADFLNLNETQ